MPKSKSFEIHKVSDHKMWANFDFRLKQIFLFWSYVPWFAPKNIEHFWCPFNKIIPPWANHMKFIEYFFTKIHKSDLNLDIILLELCPLVWSFHSLTLVSHGQMSWKTMFFTTIHSDRLSSNLVFIPFMDSELCSFINWTTSMV